MRRSELIRILGSVTYKPDFKFRFEPHELDRVEVIITASVLDADGSGQKVMINRVFVMDSRAFDDARDVHEFVFAQIRDLELHELAEWFKVDGVRIRKPH